MFCCALMPLLWSHIFKVKCMQFDTTDKISNKEAKRTRNTEQQSYSELWNIIISKKKVVLGSTNKVSVYHNYSNLTTIIIPSFKTGYAKGH